jgi:uncharacterized membrane protein YoaK (UPF0700 family)
MSTMSISIATRRGIAILAFAAGAMLANAASAAVALIALVVILAAYRFLQTRSAPALRCWRPPEAA